MALTNLLWQMITLAVMNILEQMLNAADWIMFTIEEYEVYDNIVEFLSFCVGNFYFWQTVATIGFCNYLHRLTAKFPPPIIPIDVGPIEVGPSMEELLEEKEKSLKDAASKNDDLDKESAGLRAKIDRLQKEVDFISKDRYALVREKCILQNKLGDFNSWPEFRVEYDELATEYEAMKRQRAREQISHEQILQVAKKAKLQLAAAKRAEAMSKTAHNEELKLVKQERDDAREKYKTLLNTTTTATAATTAGSNPREIALQKENSRLTLALRSQTVLLAKKASEFERMQSLVKTRSDHSASQLKSATSTILSLEEYRAKADKRIVELEEAVKEANEKAEEMEEMYMAVAFMDEAEDEKEKEEKGENEEEKGENEEEDGNGGEERPPTPWLLKQMVAMSKKERSEAGATGGGPDADGSGSEEDEEDDDEDGDGEEEESNEDEENEDEDREKKIHEENEDLFKDMIGRP